MPQDTSFFTDFLKTKTIAEAGHINAAVRYPYVDHSTGLLIEFTDGSKIQIRSYGSGHEDCHGLTLKYTDSDGNVTEEEWEEP